MTFPGNCIWFFNMYTFQQYISVVDFKNRIILGIFYLTDHLYCFIFDGSEEIIKNVDCPLHEWEIIYLCNSILMVLQCNVFKQILNLHYKQLQTANITWQIITFKAIAICCVSYSLSVTNRVLEFVWGHGIDCDRITLLGRYNQIYIMKNCSW